MVPRGGSDLLCRLLPGWVSFKLALTRNGFDGLAGLVQTKLAEDPFSGQLFVFRGRRGDRVKVLWWDGDGLCLFAKRLERGRFVWPQATSGTVHLTAAQLSMYSKGSTGDGHEERTRRS
jgi:transposase